METNNLLKYLSKDENFTQTPIGRSVQNFKNEREVDEIKSSFFLVASHELRTILASILFSATLISKYHDNGDEIKLTTHIQKIKNSVHDISIILDDLLLMEESKVEKIDSLPGNPVLAELFEKLTQVKQEI